MSRKFILPLQLIFYAVLGYFIVVKFDKLISAFSFRSDLHFFIFAALSALAYLLYYLIFSLHWTIISKPYISKHKYYFLSFFASQPYKYLPTSIFSFSARAYYSKKFGLGIKKGSMAQLLENLSIIGSGVIIFIIYLISRASNLFAIAAIVGLLLFLCMLYLIKTVRVPSVSLQVSGKKVVYVFAIAIGGWIISGLAFYLLSVAIHGSINPIQAVAINSGAITLGILAIFAPGGIGVREVIYSQYGISLSLVIGWRLVTILLDVISGTVAILLIKRSNSATNSKVGKT